MIIHSKNIVAALVLFLLSGCAMTPEYQRPAMPVADTFANNDSARPSITENGRQNNKNISDLGWREVFTDTVLQQLIATALENNRDLRETALNVEEYQAQYRIQRSAQFPTIGVDSYGSKQRTLSGSGNATSEAYSLAVGATSYELDFYGRVKNLKDRALEQYLAREETHRSATLSIVAEVTSSYLTLLADRELLEISENTRVTEEESFALIQQRAAAGIANELDLAQARTSLETVKANLALYKRQVAQDVHYLTLLTGTSLPADVVSSDRMLRDVNAIQVRPATLSSDVLLQRPDIMVAEHELKGANANIGAARASFFPTVSLTSSAGMISSDLGDLFDGGSGSWLFSPSISVPIFTAGKLKAELDVAKIQKELYVARYEKVIQTAFREVSDALVAEITYAEQIQAQQANLEANEQYYNHAMNRYKQGVDSFLTLLDAQRSLYSSKQNFLTLKLAQLENQVNLYKVLGGGWKE